MLINLKKSCLLIVDVQIKLTPLVLNHEAVVEHCAWLMRLANELAVPVHIAEQYPKGLGCTVPALAQAIPDLMKPIAKTHFSCVADLNYHHLITQESNRAYSDFILAGIETHVCILQTALQLKEMGKNVFVIVDAVSARHELDHRYGLKRMKAAGVELVTREMVFFEWLRDSAHPAFKTLSAEFMSSKEKK